MGTQQISILLFDNCDLLDSGGPVSYTHLTLPTKA